MARIRAKVESPVSSFILVSTEPVLNEDRRLKIAEEYGIIHATYPLDVDSTAFRYIMQLIEFARSEPEVAEKRGGYTKYGAYFGEPYAGWCTEFVVYCTIKTKAQFTGGEIGNWYPIKNTSGRCVRWYRNNNSFFRPDGFIPRAGDLMFFDAAQEGDSDHTALVTGVEYDETENAYYILTIEGNIPGDRPSNRIRSRRIRWDDKTIYGYGTFFPEV